MKLEGAAAVVTGASTGIGRAIAQTIARNGARVGLVGRNVEGLRQTEKLIVESGGEARLFVADLRDQRTLERIAKEVEETWGGADIIVNVAGVWHDGKAVYYGRGLADTPVEQIDEVLEVGIRAPMQLTRLLLPRMIGRKRGKILNISGTFSSGGAGWLHYYVSKKALESFTVGLADELRKHEIQVNCISPSDVATDALRKFFSEDAETALAPTDVAEFARFLLDEGAADHITGQIIVIKNKSAH